MVAKKFWVFSIVFSVVARVFGKVARTLLVARDFRMIAKVL